MRYHYVTESRQFVLGLPARDLDDDELTDREKEQLAEAVEQGLYVLEDPQGRGLADEAGAAAPSVADAPADAPPETEDPTANEEKTRDAAPSREGTSKSR